MISIYFEEVAAHQYRVNRNHSTGSHSRANEVTDYEIGDEEDDD